MARKLKADIEAGMDDRAGEAIVPASVDAASDPVDAICAVCDGMKRHDIASTLRAAWARMK